MGLGAQHRPDLRGLSTGTGGAVGVVLVGPVLVALGQSAARGFEAVKAEWGGRSGLRTGLGAPA